MTDASPDRDTAPDGASSRAGATSPPPETAGSSSSTQDLTLGLENLIVEASEARGDKKMETGAVVATTSGTDPLEMDDIDDEYFSQLMLANFSSSAIQRLKKYRKSARERPQTPPEERKRRQELWAWRRKQKAALFQEPSPPLRPLTQLEQEEEDEKDRLYKKWEEESDHSHWGSGCPCSWEADYFDFEEEVLKEREEDPWYPKCPDYVEPIDIDVGVKLYQL